MLDSCLYPKFQIMRFSLPISEVLCPTNKLNNLKNVWILLIVCDLHELVYCTLWGESFKDLDMGPLVS
jgi:hypothetical protein